MREMRLQRLSEHEQQRKRSGGLRIHIAHRKAPTVPVRGRMHCVHPEKGEK